MKSSLKIAFAGTPTFAEQIFKAILDGGFNVQLVLTQPDRKAGRGMQMLSSPVKQLALKHNIPVLQPHSLKTSGRFVDEANLAFQRLSALEMDVMIVVAYGLILPSSVLSLPTFGCVNVHASLLPRWRGAAPIQRAIEAGDRQTGICLMQMDEGLDTGAIISQSAIDIEDNVDALMLQNQLAELAAPMVIDYLLKVLDIKRNGSVGVVPSTPQVESGVTYAHKIHKNETWMNWRASSTDLVRKLASLSPNPGMQSSLLVGAKRQSIVLKWVMGDMVCSEAMQSANEQAKPGEIIEVFGDGWLVACGRGSLIIRAVKPAGGRRMTVKEFMNGCPVQAGDCFELPLGS